MSTKFEDKKIAEALELLNEFARDKKAELRDMVSEKYSSLNSALGGAAEELQDQARETWAQDEEEVRGFSSKMDEKVHKNPWPYLCGTALGFLILGVFLNRPKK
jgi:ElaB/YqjD/DUF883 family membrane-anchored ribosome-binding protein